MMPFKTLLLVLNSFDFVYCYKVFSWLVFIYSMILFNKSNIKKYILISLFNYETYLKQIFSIEHFIFTLDVTQYISMILIYYSVLIAVNKFFTFMIFN